MNIMKFRPLFYLISAIMLLTSVFSIIKWGFSPSIDFVGGTVWQINIKAGQDQISSAFKDVDVILSAITPAENNSILLKTQHLSEEQKQKLQQAFRQLDADFVDLRFETLGPSLGKELLQKTLVAIILSSLALLIFIASRFSDPAFGVAAVLAMFHDTFILIGCFSLLGHFFGAELDALFVTALLTTLSASVHDTVVTFNRIRELRLQSFSSDWVDLANQAVTETIVRSVNNSMTVIFMLFSLVVLGGVTTRWFAVALLIGVTCGTYSSTGVAIPLVLFFKKKKNKTNPAV